MSLRDSALSLHSDLCSNIPLSESSSLIVLSERLPPLSHYVHLLYFFLQCPIWLWGMLYFYLFNICLSSLKFKLCEYMCFILFTAIFLELTRSKYIADLQEIFTEWINENVPYSSGQSWNWMNSSLWTPHEEPHAKEWICTLILYHIQKSTQNGIKT